MTLLLFKRSWMMVMIVWMVVSRVVSTASAILRLQVEIRKIQVQIRIAQTQTSEFVRFDWRLSLVHILQTLTLTVVGAPRAILRFAITLLNARPQHVKDSHAHERVLDDAWIQIGRNFVQSFLNARSNVGSERSRVDATHLFDLENAG